MYRGTKHLLPLKLILPNHPHPTNCFHSYPLTYHYPIHPSVIRFDKNEICLATRLSISTSLFQFLLCENMEDKKCPMLHSSSYSWKSIKIWTLDFRLCKGYLEKIFVDCTQCSRYITICSISEKNYLPQDYQLQFTRKGSAVKITEKHSIHTINAY